MRLTTLFALVFALLFMVGCASSGSGGSSSLASHDGFAWSEDGGRLPIGHKAVARDDLRAAFRNEVATRLAAYGIFLVSAQHASLSLDDQVTVSRRSKNNDPTYNYYTVDRYEDGHTRLVFKERGQQETLLDVSAERELRLVARGVGLTKIKWATTHEERRWDIPAMVADLFSDPSLQSYLAKRKLDGDRKVSPGVRRDLMDRIRRLEPDLPESIEK